MKPIATMDAIAFSIPFEIVFVDILNLKDKDKKNPLILASFCNSN